MNCAEFHSELIRHGQMECPFCNKKLEETKSIKPRCCDRPNLINDTHIVCTNCGVVNGYLTANEFVDFYENMYRIRKKYIIENITFYTLSMILHKRIRYKLVIMIERKS